MDSNKIKKGLGRVLSSLIGETKIDVQKNQLSISDLIPNKFKVIEEKKYGLSKIIFLSILN